jgi:type 1 fimbriae regulatory protein FimB/type 1 fimbriae regulatory protein FimE
MTKARLKLVSPATAKRTVAPVRRPNAQLRPREHLTEREVEKLIEAAKVNRWGQRDASMILIAFRHGLRASELCELQWSDVEFETGTLHLRRAKGGATATHPLLGDELRALRALKRDAKSPFIFVSERGSPSSVAGLQKMVERAGTEAKMPFKVHPHMLRHATGFALANKGTDTRTLQAYLGHRSIQSTVRYTELAPGRFKNLGVDCVTIPVSSSSSPFTKPISRLARLSRDSQSWRALFENA